MVIEVEEVLQPQPDFMDALYFLQVDVFILDGSPEPLHKNRGAPK